MKIILPSDATVTTSSQTSSENTRVYYPQCFGFLSVIFDGLGDADSSPTIIPFYPRTASVELNDYLQADTFEADFDASVFPFAPDFLRSVAIELYMFSANDVITADQFDKYKKPENLLIAGLIDDASLAYGHTGNSFRVSGRDYTSLLLAREWEPEKRIPVGGDLADTVQSLVDVAVQKDRVGTTLQVRYVDTSTVKVAKSGQTLTRKIVDTTKRSSPTIGNGASKTKQKGFAAASGKNYWDVIYGLCINHGKIAFVRGVEVIITDPHTLTLESEARSAYVAWGNDLSSLDFRRHLGKEAVPQIIGTFYDKKTRTDVVVKIPSDNIANAKRKNKPGKIKGVKGVAHTVGTEAIQISGANTVTESSKRVLLPRGIADKTTAERYLKAYYDTIARSESHMTFTTKHLKDLQGKSLISLRAGDPVRVDFDPFVQDELRNLTSGARRTALTNVGFSDQVASIIADNYDKINQIKKPYYTKAAHILWDKDEGIAISAECLNYVYPHRDDVQ